MNFDIYASFSLPIEHIDGIGPVAAKKLQKLGYHTIGDLLFHLPKDWIDDRVITPISALLPKQAARIQGIVESRRSNGYGRKATVHVTVADDTGQAIHLSFFHANYMMSDARLQEGQAITVRGVADRWGSKWQMTHPEWLPVERFQAGWIPQYASLAGLSGKKIGLWIKKALSLVATTSSSTLDALLIDQSSLLSALQLTHLNEKLDPHSQTMRQAMTRLQLEELIVYLNIMSAQRKQAEIKTIAMPSTNHEHDFISGLPYPLTPAQKHVWQEIGDDLASGKRKRKSASTFFKSQ
jgi:ATP-dependent DNA helicase RecG